MKAGSLEWSHMRGADGDVTTDSGKRGDLPVANSRRIEELGERKENLEWTTQRPHGEGANSSRALEQGLIRGSTRIGINMGLF